MNTIENTNWLSNRQVTNWATAQTLPAIVGRQSSSNLILEATRFAGFIPSWIILLMVLVATVAICSTVLIRSRAELTHYSTRYDRMTSEVDNIRRANFMLQVEINRMTYDQGTIEAAARERLGMVRPNDIIIPIVSAQAVSNTDRVSFVR